MPQKATDAAAIAVAITAPGWATALAQVNVVLTFLSLLLGIAFMLWRWRRTAAGRGE